ncbi:hypothetical protein ACTHGU_05290 [Chitinophagaceae bacterium MMS25-I14]
MVYSFIVAALRPMMRDTNSDEEVSNEGYAGPGDCLPLRRSRETTPNGRAGNVVAVNHKAYAEFFNEHSS